MPHSNHARIIFVNSILTLSAAFAALRVQAVEFHDRMLSRIQATAIPETIRVAPSTGRIAYVIPDGCCMQRAVVDGVLQDSHEEVANIQFSPNGRHSVYTIADSVCSRTPKSDSAALDGNHNSDIVETLACEATKYVVVDGHRGRGFMRIYNLSFFQDTDRLVYVGDSSDERIFVASVDLSSYLTTEYLEAEVASVSRSGKRMANVVNTESGKQLVLTDGIPGPPFDEIGTKDPCCYARQPIFSNDERRVAYTGRSGARRALLLNDLTVQYYDDIIWNSIGFCGAGRNLCYIARAKAQHVLLVDKRELARGDDALTPIVSQLGSRVVFAVRRNRSWFVTVNSHSYGPYARVDSLIADSTGERAAWIVHENGKSYAVQNGQRGPAYDSIQLMAFSENGQHFAYSGCFKAEVCVINKDGQQSESYDNCGPVRFDDTGANFAYEATRGTRNFIVANGRNLPFDFARELRVGAGGSMTFVFTTAAGDYVNTDNRQEGPYRSVSTLSLNVSSDGKSSSYVASDDLDRQSFVINGIQGRPYTTLLRSSPLIWSRVPAWDLSRTHFAYAADLDDHQLLVVDNKESKHYRLLIHTSTNLSVLEQHQIVFAYDDQKIYEIDIDLSK